MGASAGALPAPEIISILFLPLPMTNQIIIKGKKISLAPIAGTTVLRASAPLKCSICGKYRPFFYNIQIHSGEPAMLICVAKCHRHLQKQLMSHIEDHFFIRGIDAPLSIPSKFFIYCRVSTAEVTHPKHNLEGQKDVLISFAYDHKFVVANVFQESCSAMSSRPVFDQMLQRIEKGEADAILVQDVSRLVRNATDGRRIAAMLGQGVLFQVITPFQVLNHNSFILQISMQEKERQALSRNVKRGLQTRKSRGN